MFEKYASFLLESCISLQRCYEKTQDLVRIYKKKSSVCVEREIFDKSLFMRTSCGITSLIPRDFSNVSGTSGMLGA